MDKGKGVIYKDSLKEQGQKLIDEVKKLQEIIENLPESELQTVKSIADEIDISREKLISTAYCVIEFDIVGDEVDSPEEDAFLLNDVDNITFILDAIAHFGLGLLSAYDFKVDAVASGWYWVGVMHGFLHGSKEGKKELSKKAQEAAKVRHAEDRDCKKFVIEYYNEHIKEFSSKDDAATKIVEINLVPYKPRTIREWLINQPDVPKTK